MKAKMKQLRQEKGWTQQRTATELGISIDAVKSIETGRALPSLKTAFKMKNTFGCSCIDEMIEVVM